jgi:hypothetical protein
MVLTPRRQRSGEAPFGWATASLDREGIRPDGQSISEALIGVAGGWTCCAMTAPTWSVCIATTNITMSDELKKLREGQR